MTDPPKPRCRWFQFSLRSLLIAVTLVAGLLVAWRVYVEPYRRQTSRFRDISSKLFRQILDRIRRLRTMVPIHEPG